MPSGGPLGPPLRQLHQLPGGCRWWGWALGTTGEQSLRNMQDQLMEVRRLRAGPWDCRKPAVTRLSEGTPPLPLGPEETPIHDWHCRGITLQPEEGTEAQSSHGQWWEAGWGSVLQPRPLKTSGGWTELPPTQGEERVREITPSWLS